MKDTFSLPLATGACRKNEISLLRDPARRRGRGATRSAGLFDKALQLANLTGYTVSIMVQPPLDNPGELSTLMFSTNDDLSANMAELVRRFGPQLNANGARYIGDLPAGKMLSAYLARASEPALVVSQRCIPVPDADPIPNLESGLDGGLVYFSNSNPFLLPDDFAVDSTANIVPLPQTEALPVSTSIPLPSPPLPPLSSSAPAVVEESARRWRVMNLHWGFAQIPKRLTQLEAM